MTQTDSPFRPLTSQELDDGWCLDEAPHPAARADEDDPYAEYVLETRAPASGFEQAFWEQVEGRRPPIAFGTVPPDFGAKRRN